MRYERQEPVATVRTVTDKVTCDICGVEIRERPQAGPSGAGHLVMPTSAPRRNPGNAGAGLMH